MIASPIDIVRVLADLDDRELEAIVDGVDVWATSSAGRLVAALLATYVDQDCGVLSPRNATDAETPTDATVRAALGARFAYSRAILALDDLRDRCRDELRRKRGT